MLFISDKLKLITINTTYSILNINVFNCNNIANIVIEGLLLKRTYGMI